MGRVNRADCIREMDEYRDGQSDEGEPDCNVGKCWDDGISSDDDFRASRKRPSSSLQDDSDTCKNDAPRSRARDEIAPAEEFAIVPYDPHPTPNPQEAIAEVANSLANKTTRCEDLLRSAKALGSVPLQQAARRELRRLQKKACGPWRERATVKVTMAHLEDRTAFTGHLERTRARMLKDEEQRLKEKRKATAENKALPLHVQDAKKMS